MLKALAQLQDADCAIAHGRQAADHRVLADAEPHGGPLKNPAIQPELGEAAARAGAAVGLGLLFPPLALLPTIQLGVGENSQCETLQSASERRRQQQAPEGAKQR